MRITQSLMNYNLKRNLENSMENLYETQGQISSGTKLSKLSDSPDDLAIAMNVRTTLNKQEQYKKNIEGQLAWLGQNETALTDSADIMSRAKEVSIYAGNPAVGDMEMTSMSLEIDELLEQAFVYANTLLGQSHIFSGYQMNNDVESVTPNDPANSKSIQVGDKLFYYNDDVVLREIAPGLTMQVNMSGEVMFNAIKTLTDLKNALDAGDKDKATGCLGDIDNNFNELVQQRTVVGSKTKRLEDLKQQMDYQEVDLEKYLSDASGVPIEEATVKLANLQLTYQTSLAISSKLLQSNILDYLR